MNPLTEPAMPTRRPMTPSLDVTSPHATPRLATASRRLFGIAGIGSGSALLVTPDSWHLPGRHEHGRPLLRRTGGAALARSWS
jgi:hypothetical protein